MAARMSPGGALIRTSRLFSIPNPISAAPGDVRAAAKRESPTATTPFPTRLAITTTQRSRARGDWGLKRPLPPKMTAKTSTPVLRVKEMDTVEHVTDFSSASDHALTLEKFQELGVAVSVPPEMGQSILAGSSGVREQSVFEEDYDFTFVPKGTEAATDFKRWKFRGPWLAGLTEGEFTDFIKKKVRYRRTEFRRFLKKKLAAEMSRPSQYSSFDTEEPKEVLAKEITDDQLTDYIRRLRNDRVTLYGLVGEFLDLAPLSPPASLDTKYLSATRGRRLKPTNPYARDGPPITHPSAGLSYLRTSAYVENHPVYGPQRSHSPVLSRIVTPRQGMNSAKMGVGGFITEVPMGDNYFNARSYRGRDNLLPGVAHFDLLTDGGPKAYIQPTSVKIDPSGKAFIKLHEVDAEAQLVKQEMYGDGHVYQSEVEGLANPLPEAEPESSDTRNGGAARTPPAETDILGSSKNYGLDS